jgi:diguanylate cyclase (GGDEF)-like protein
MELDIRTLLVAVALVTAFCAGARVMLCRLHPTLPGLGHWAWASVLAAVALGLMAAHEHVDALYSLTLAQGLIGIGFVLAWDGFRRFCKLRPHSWPTLTALMLGALLTALLAHAAHSLPVRAVANGVLVTTLSALIARDLLTAGRSGCKAMRGTGWLYAANALFFIARTVAVLQSGEIVGLYVSTGFTAATLLWWLCGHVGITLGMVLMAGERLQQDLDRQASSDPLTGALNRRAFGQLAEREVAHSRRSGEKLSLLMMDLDYFKQINDRLGHAAGDQVLCLFVAVAQRMLRREDVFCRFGGEEFIALLPGSNREQAVQAADRLRGAFADEADETLSAPFPLTVSIGVAELHADEALEALIRRTDAALYQAKAAGRNCSVFADAPPPAMPCPQEA